ncbi:C-methyl transferase, partial [Mytilinidion resinicola]
MRVLEVGAGTGSMTRLALKALKTKEDMELPESARLCRYSRYDFTDISPSLVGAAQEEFGSTHPKTHFSRLDLEQDPENQGFELGTYDIVIAGNVLHATADICKTLRHVRASLKPGGRL